MKGYRPGNIIEQKAVKEWHLKIAADMWHEYIATGLQQEKRNGTT